MDTTTLRRVLVVGLTLLLSLELSLQVAGDKHVFEICAPDLRIAYSSPVQEEIAVGRGAYGVVFESTWMGTKVAAKVLNDRNALQKEVDILAKLRHPNVAQFNGFLQGESATIVMEKMDGDLHNLIKKQRRRKPPFRTNVAVDLISQIAAGMLYVHSQGIFHGDLKTSNVLIAYRGRHPYLEAKTSDFGTSQFLEELGHSKDGLQDVYSGYPFKGTVGTSGFRAPEVYPLAHQKASSTWLESTSSHKNFAEVEETGQPTYSAKADVFSFAMTAYEVATGETPYASDDRSQIYRRVVAGDRPRLPGWLPVGLAALLQICWDTNPKRRPTFSRICEMLRDVKQDLYSPFENTLCFKG